MPETKAPLYREGIRTTIVITKLPVLSKKDIKAIRPRLGNWTNIPIEFLDNKELLAIVEDGHLLSRIGNQPVKDKNTFIEKVRRLYKTDNKVKVWID